MKSYDHDAAVYDGEVYCNECLPDEATEDDVSPIFADSEWHYVPKCRVCDAEHDYVTILTKEIPMSDHKLAALMKHLGVEADDVLVPGDDTEVFAVNHDEYRVLTDEEANEATRDAMRDSLWAFNFSFLSRYVPELSGARVEKAWTKMTGELCEDAGPIVEALLGRNLDRALDDAAEEDGRGHFLAHYDHEEHEVRVTDDLGEKYTFYIYRVN